LTSTTLTLLCEYEALDHCQSSTSVDALFGYSPAAEDGRNLAALVLQEVLDLCAALESEPEESPQRHGTSSATSPWMTISSSPWLFLLTLAPVANRWANSLAAFFRSMSVRSVRREELHSAGRPPRRTEELEAMDRGDVLALCPFDPLDVDLGLLELLGRRRFLLVRLRFLWRRLKTAEA
jgi:hypothetical protein